MIHVALKGLAGRKLRAILTAVAIVLGVAMISGTYVLTDTISSSFKAIFAEIYKNTDAAVTGHPVFGRTDDNGNSLSPSFPESVLARVRAVPEVGAASGSVSGEAQVIGTNGKAIVSGGSPNLGFSIDPTRNEFNVLTLVDGDWPKAGEVVIDKTTAGKAKVRVGDNVGIQGNGPVQHYRLAGIVKFGAAGGIGGATLAGFDLPTAQALFDKEGKLDQIAISAKTGVTIGSLVRSLRAALPRTVDVRSGKAQAERDASDTTEFITFLQDFLLAFGGIALFVGSFVIANSLSITIAQRTRELATLRTLGASRRQVLTSIVVESLIMGVLASVVGLFLGLALARGLAWLFDKVGFTLPKNGLIFETRTAIVSLAAGIIVTLVASLRPALRATRVPPIAAVREGAVLPSTRFRRLRSIGALALAAIGFALVAYGLFAHGLGTKQVLLSMGVGALLVFIGVALFSSRLVGPLSAAVSPVGTWAVVLLSVLVWPFSFLRWLVSLGVGTRREFPNVWPDSAMNALAKHNARRNTQRTASTAAALMIGLALVTLVAMLASGITASFSGAVNEIFVDGDYAVTAQNNFSPIPIAAGTAAAHAPGVTGATSVRAGTAQIFGSSESVTAVEGDAAGLLRLKWTEGSQAVLNELGADGAFVDNGYAKKHRLHRGSPIRLLSPTGKTLHLVVKGVFDPPTGGSPFGPVTFSAATFDGAYQNPRNLYSFLRMRGGQTDANLAALDKTLEQFPNAKAQTRQKFIDNLLSGLNATLNILYVLLALSVVISIFGIVNTLVLSVFERTRELGMLRAIGMTRRQVRRMIRHESVITALIGAVLGILLGIVLGGLLAARVDFILFSLPVGQLIAFGIAAVLVGVLASLLPARRAAKLNPLEALQYE